MSSVNIIIVEDSEHDLELMYQVYQQNDAFHIQSHYRSGDDFLAEMTTIAASPPDLISVDLRIPGVDGLELIPMLREHSSLALTPIIVLSSSTRTEDINNCYAAGANSYHQKPMAPDQFRHTLESIRNYWLNTAILPVNKPS